MTYQKNIKLILAMLIMSINPMVHGSDTENYGNAYTGFWLTDDGDTIVKISECGSSLCGRIVGFSNDEVDEDNLTEEEENQGLEALKKICSMDFFGGVKKKGSQWKAGWILDFEDEKKYSVNLELVKDILKVRAYKGIELFGESFLWKRIDKIKVTCDSIIKGAVK